MQADDAVQIRCTRCKAKFRDKARRVVSGYSAQCPSCECLIFFEDGSPNEDVSRALREAARVRKALKAEQAEELERRARLAAKEQAADHDEDDDAQSSASKRLFGRRSHPSFRSRSS